MSTYEIPGPPPGNVVWGPTYNGEGWNKYELLGDGEWHLRVGTRTVERWDWPDLLMRGPLTDEDPDPPLGVLRDRVVEAAVAKVQWDTPATWQELKDAVHNYNKKKGTE